MRTIGVALEYEGKYQCVNVSYDKTSTIDDVLEKALSFLMLSKKIDINKLTGRYRFY